MAKEEVAAVPLPEPRSTQEQESSQNVQPRKILSQQQIHAKIEELEQQITELVAKYHLKVDADLDFADFDEEIVSFETKV